MPGPRTPPTRKSSTRKVTKVKTVALARPGEVTPETPNVRPTKTSVSPGYKRVTLTIGKDSKYFESKGPGIGLALLELPGTSLMPSRLIVINTSEAGLAAKAGLEVRDQLITIAGHDVATELENSKARVNALLVALGGANHLEVVVERKDPRSPVNRAAQHGEASGQLVYSPYESPVGDELQVSPQSYNVTTVVDAV
jgi:hypothetical protein